MFSGNRKPQRTAVFISGGGSTLQAILEMQHQMRLCLLVTSRKNALGVLKGRRYGLPSVHMSRQMDFSELQQILEKHQIEKIVLAGFMKILPPEFVNKWQGRILNIHPSLLPEFPGMDSAKRNWQAGTDMGVTIHDVTAEMDAGAPLLQMRSLRADSGCQFGEAEIILRRTEQNLLREMVSRYFR